MTEKQKTFDYTEEMIGIIQRDLQEVRRILSELEIRQNKIKHDATLAENKRMLGKYEICCPKCHYVFSTPECPSDVYDECGCGVSNAALRLKENEKK